MAGTPAAYGQTRQEAAREWHGNGGETVRNGMSNRPSFRVTAPRGAACGLDGRFPHQQVGRRPADDQYNSVKILSTRSYSSGTKQFFIRRSWVFITRPANSLTVPKVNLQKPICGFLRRQLIHMIRLHDSSSPENGWNMEEPAGFGGFFDVPSLGLEPRTNTL